MNTFLLMEEFPSRVALLYSTEGRVDVGTQL
jgi:hypothetical protein